MTAAPRQQITRWSLRMLADIKLTPSTAQWLVDDVALRLDRQNDACRHVQAFVEQERRQPPFVPQQQHALTVPLRERNDSSGPRIIRAVLHDFRQGKSLVNVEAESRRRRPDNHVSVVVAKLQSDYMETLKSLQNLQRLHADTLRLCQELHPLIFQRWSKADQHLVFSIMEQIRARHANSIETWADIVLALRAIHQDIHLLMINNNNMASFHDPLLFPNIDSVLQGRWGIQLLCDHYVALHKGITAGGAVRDIAMYDLLEGAVMQSRQVIEAHYQEAPEVVILASVKDIHVTAVHAWLYHALVELLKNAMAATLKKHLPFLTTTVTTPVNMEDQYDDSDDSDNDDDGGFHKVESFAPPPGTIIPPVYIQVERRDGYVVIDIHDQGTGLQQPRQKDDASSSSSSEWAFGFTTSSCLKRWDRLEEHQSYAMVRSPVSSLGVGLNVSRTMMRHFGGNVELLHRPATVDLDVGCTARVWINTNTDYVEQLPEGYEQQEHDDDEHDENHSPEDDAMIILPKAVPM